MRVGPNEVHIRDAAFYSSLYNMTIKVDKYPYFYKQFGVGDTAFTAVSPELHRVRRAALAPYFTQKVIQSLAPRIQSLSTQLVERMKLCQQTGQPVPLFYSFRCLTVDLISQHIFGQPLGLLERPDWGKAFYASNRSLWQITPVIKQMPWLLDVLICLPRSVTAATSPDALEVLDHRARVDLKTMEALNAPEPTEKGARDSIVKGLARDTGLPQSDRIPERIRNEVFTLLAAGFETTGATLSRMTYLVLANDDVRQKLMAELRKAIPDPANIPDWHTLEKLPYLFAVVKESLRYVSLSSLLLKVRKLVLAYVTNVT